MNLATEKTPVYLQAFLSNVCDIANIEFDSRLSLFILLATLLPTAQRWKILVRA